MSFDALTSNHVPIEGNVISMKVADGVTSIKKGSVLFLSASMEVKPCTGSVRGPIAGVAATDFPPPRYSNVKNLAQSTDKGPAVYGGGKLQRRIGVILNQCAWVLIEIPVSGSTITMGFGDSLVPSTDSSGTGSAGCETLTTPSAGDAAEIIEQDKIFARALSGIHTEFKNTDQAAFGQNEVATLAAGAAIVYGYVFARIFNKG